MSNIYTPRTEVNSPGFVGAYAEAINFGKRIRLPDGGSPVRDLLHVDDLASACRAFNDSIIRHGTYNLGGGRENALSLRSLIEKMERVSGLQAVIDEEYALPDPVPRRYISDLSRIRQELDWEPQIALDDGLKTLFE